MKMNNILSTQNPHQFPWECKLLYFMTVFKRKEKEVREREVREKVERGKVERKLNEKTEVEARSFLSDFGGRDCDNRF